MINISQNAILFSEDFVSYLGNNVQKTNKNSNFRTAKKRENISRPRFYGEWDRNNFEYPRIGPDFTVIFFYRHIF